MVGCLSGRAKAIQSSARRISDPPHLARRLALHRVVSTGPDLAFDLPRIFPSVDHTAHTDISGVALQDLFVPLELTPLSLKCLRCMST